MSTTDARAAANVDSRILFFVSFDVYFTVMPFAVNLNDVPSSLLFPLIDKDGRGGGAREACAMPSWKAHFFGSSSPSFFRAAITLAATLRVIVVSAANKSDHSSSVHSFRCSTHVTPKVTSLLAVPLLQGRALPRNHRPTAEMSDACFDIGKGLQVRI